MSEGGAIELRHGRYQDVMQDVEADLCLPDPPYSPRTHGGQRHGRKDAGYTAPGNGSTLAARGLSYDAWTEDDVREFVQFWHPRTRGWICAFTSHDLIDVYAAAFREVGRYVFAPVSIVQHAMNVRLAGDGPSNWTTYLVRARNRGPFVRHLMVARPRRGEPWGTLPGAYYGSPHDVGENAFDRSKRPVAGGKPLWLMRVLVRHYSRPGDRVVDPTAGGCTTLIAAALEGRSAIGAERDPRTHAAGSRLVRAYERGEARQGALFEPESRP